MTPVARIFASLAALVAVLALPSPAAHAAGRDGASKRQVLRGTWTIVYTSTTDEFPPVPGAMTFTADGGFIATDTGQLANPVATAAHGAWKATGPRQFAITFVNNAIDETGTFIGNAKLRGTITVDASGTHFSGPARFEAYDLDGNVVFTADETIAGTLLEVEPLEQ